MKLFRFLVLLAFIPQADAQIITATVTFTNALNLTNAVAISNAVIKVNSSVRTFTNSLTTPSTQILIKTNIGTNLNQQASQFLINSYTYRFTGVTPSGTYSNVVLRGTNGQPMLVEFGPSTYASVTYSTNLGTNAQAALMRMDTLSEPQKTNQASGLAEAINSAYNTNGIAASKITGTITPSGAFGLQGKVVSTNYTLSTSDLYVGVSSTTGAVTLAFPSAATASNLTYWIKDEGGFAPTTNITLQLQNGDRIDGATNMVLRTSRAGVIVLSRGYTNWYTIPTAASAGSIGITIDGGGSAITTGIKGYLEIPYNCTILQATMLADVSGSAVIDVWKDSYANYPPTVADTITAAAKPTISAATKSQDLTLTGWTKTITAGDILAFKVDSAATITRLTLTLQVQK